MDVNNPIPLIYQSGYLTIKDYDREFQNYRLDFPNDEVRYGFINFLVPFYTPMKNNDQGFYIGKFVQELRTGDYESFLTRLEAFFADIPYELNDQTERHYQVIFYLVFKLMGQFTEAEVRSARGRADAVVKTPQYVYVFEFKLNGTAEEAIKQINEKRLPNSLSERSSGSSEDRCGIQCGNPQYQSLAGRDKVNMIKTFREES